MKNNIEIIVLKKEKITDFSQERNELLSKASKEWVFFIDSDEKISDELEKEIDNLDFNYDGYFIKRKNLLLGRILGKDKVLRLARRDSGKWYGKVHETWRVKGQVTTLKNYLIHNTADSLSEAIAKVNNYSTLFAKEKMENRIKSNIYKIVFFPIGRFVQSMIEGKGFVFSMLHGFHSFLTWSKLYTWQTKSN